MEITELMKKVRTIEIKTNRLVQELFGGQYHSAFKGKGLEFADLRNYQAGDDFRSIDWKSTARFNTPYVKMYEEERELTIMLLLDVSSSMDFASKYSAKKDIAAEIAALIAFSADRNEDKIGAMIFSDDVENYITPAKGLSHSLHIIRDIIAAPYDDKKTDLNKAIDHLMMAQKKRCVVFMISDFEGDIDLKKLNTVSKKHDFIGIRIKDILEEKPPEFFSGVFTGSESGESIGVALGDNLEFISRNAKRLERFDNEIKKRGIDIVDLYTDSDYVKEMRLFFKKRISRRRR